jgi:hypothetical protein
VDDRCWNLLRANQGAVRLTKYLLGNTQVEPSAEPVNLAVALISSEGLRPYFANWAHYFLRGVHADAHSDGAPERLAFLHRVLALPDADRGVASCRDPGSGRSDAFSAGRYVAKSVHLACDVGNAAGCDLAGGSHRMPISDGRGDRHALSGNGRRPLKTANLIADLSGLGA